MSKSTPEVIMGQYLLSSSISINFGQTVFFSCFSLLTTGSFKKLYVITQMNWDDILCRCIPDLNPYWTQVFWSGLGRNLEILFGLRVGFVHAGQVEELELLLNT